MDHTPESSEVRSRVRRRDRAVTDEAWISGHLTKSLYGVLGTEDDGQPFLTPLVFVFDAETKSLYFHGSRAGRMFQNVNGNPKACFNVCRMGAIISAPEACKFDVEYESVTAFGRLTVLGDPADAARALQLLVAKYGGDATQRMPAEALKRTAVYRFEIEEWSGKRNVTAP
jgi:nitroimidazol reductase NimA-like FMN-containing flavoprotein (pyridoxamine 5'-phosphate oxidase superfamily)